jgi:broad specificity phosphatase PhoE
VFWLPQSQQTTMTTCASAIPTGLIVYLIRHGETGHNRHLVTTGSVDETVREEPLLTEDGHTQAIEIATALAPIISDRCTVFSSEFMRAIQTASPLLVKKRKPVTIDRQFNEKEKTDGETMEQFISRARACWDRFSALAKGGQPKADAEPPIHIVFTHSLFISALLGSDFTTRMIHIPNGSITKIRFDTNGVGHITYVGSTAHLTRLTGMDTLV